MEQNVKPVASGGGVLAVIPARLASQRLPQKPLKQIEGKTLLQRVWEQGLGAHSVDRIVIATDDDRIAELGRSFGAEVLMTSDSITTGSQRVAAASRMLDGGYRIVVNVQGDMAFIRPELIDQCVDFLDSGIERFDMATIATPIFDREVFHSVSDVKVVVGENQRALYFSRAPVPHSRDGNLLQTVHGEIFGYKHFGLYAFQPAVLSEYETDTLASVEGVEKLEQLRLLERGYRIGVHVVSPELTANSVEVDTESDLERSRAIARGLQKA